MPLTASGEKMLSSMQKEYGDKKGKQVFYAKLNKDKKKAYTKKLHEMGK